MPTDFLAAEPLGKKAQRILWRFAPTNLEVDVRTGRDTSAPDLSDLLTLLDRVAPLHEELRAVTVERLVPVRVLDHDGLPVARLPSRELHDARERGADRRPVAGRDVDPRVVHAPVEDRVVAGAVTARDPAVDRPAEAEELTESA